jgi:hypothetical protein
MLAIGATDCTCCAVACIDRGAVQCCGVGIDAHGGDRDVPRDFGLVGIVIVSHREKHLLAWLIAMECQHHDLVSLRDGGCSHNLAIVVASIGDGVVTNDRRQIKVHGVRVDRNVIHATRLGDRKTVQTVVDQIHYCIVQQVNRPLSTALYRVKGTRTSTISGIKTTFGIFARIIAVLIHAQAHNPRHRHRELALETHGIHVWSTATHAAKPCLQPMNRDTPWSNTWSFYQSNHHHHHHPRHCSSQRYLCGCVIGSISKSVWFREARCYTRTSRPPRTLICASGCICTITCIKRTLPIQEYTSWSASMLLAAIQQDTTSTQARKYLSDIAGNIAITITDPIRWAAIIAVGNRPAEVDLLAAGTTYKQSDQVRVSPSSHDDDICVGVTYCV